jgi:Leucine-rich repeat (LRR) protein
MINFSNQGETMMRHSLKIVFIMAVLLMFGASSAMSVVITTEPAQMEPNSTCAAAGTLRMTFNQADRAAMFQQFPFLQIQYLSLRLNLTAPGLPESAAQPMLCRSITGTSQGLDLRGNPIPNSGSLVRLDQIGVEVSNIFNNGVPDIDGYVYAESGQSFVEVYLTNMREMTETQQFWIQIGLSQVTEPTTIQADVRDMTAPATLNMAAQATNNLSVRFSYDDLNGQIGSFAQGAIPTTEREALIKLYESTNGDNWTNKTSWLGELGTECDWFGITCTEGHVTAIGLNSNNLTGTLPAEIKDLAFLKTIILSDNQITGVIPVGIGELSALETLSLDHNQLTGSIPAELGGLTNLKMLNTGDNQLSGTIPAGLGNLTGLMELNIAANQLTGSIPTGFGSLTALETLKLHSNRLSGSIPAGLGSLLNLKTLELDNNQLTGTLPASLGNLVNLVYLSVYSNQLTGTIPPGLGSLTKLETLYLCCNELSGTLPSALGNLSALKYLHFQENLITGGLPAELGNLTQLLELYAYSNQLAGPVPTAIMNLTALTDQGSNFTYNGLFTDDPAVKAFMDSKQTGGNWVSTQTVAPANLAAGTPTTTEVPLTWSPIAYTGNAGGYEVYYATVSGGPFTLFSTTGDKTTSEMKVTGLNPGTEYFFRLRTVTQAHEGNKGAVYSAYTPEVPVKTEGITPPPPTGSAPVFLPDWGFVYTYTTTAGTFLAFECGVMDHDGIGENGATHLVSAATPDGRVVQLGYDGRESDTIAYYWGTLDLGGNPANAIPGNYTFTVKDPEGNVGTFIDNLNVSALEAPDQNSFTPSLKNPVAERLNVTYDNVFINGQLYDDFNSYNSMQDVDRAKWRNPENPGLSIQNGQLNIHVENVVGSTNYNLAAAPIDSFTSMKADITVTDATSDNQAARFCGRLYNNGVADVYVYIRVSRNKVSYDLGYGQNDSLQSWVILAKGDLMQVTPGQTITASISWDGTAFTFDADGNNATYTPSGTVLPLTDRWIWLDAKSYLNMADTTPAFTWDAIPGNPRYRVRIYNSNQSQTVWRGYEMGTTHMVPPGILKPGIDYRYRIDIRDGHAGFDLDNFSKDPVSNSDNFLFTTGREESQPPHIDLDHAGVQTWNDALAGPHVNFWIKVRDAQGVPGDIRSVKAVYPNGSEIPLYYDSVEEGNTATCGVYRGETYGTIQGGTYTLIAEDMEGNKFTLAEELTPNPIGFPSTASLTPVHNTVIQGTAMNFDWEDVPGAAFYQLEIFDQEFKPLFKLNAMTSDYQLAPGFLKPDTFYRYRITTRREFFEQNVDNGSYSPFYKGFSPAFMTGAMTGGTNLPSIDLAGYGAAVVHYAKPGSGESVYGLLLNVKVSDADGVPGNIQSVKAVYPNGTVRDLILSEQSQFQGEYEWTDLSLGLAGIQAGTYTFTVTDGDGNTAQVTDELTVNPLPIPVTLSPQKDGLMTITQRVIDWEDVPGAARYNVTIFNGWDDEIHDSTDLSVSQYTIPEGVLELNKTYSYDVEAAREPAGQDVDNESGSHIYYGNRVHFTVTEEPVIPPEPPVPPQTVGPVTESIIAQPPVTLMASPFSAPDGGVHEKTQWLVRPAGGVYNAAGYDPSFTYLATSGPELTALTLTALEPGMKYFWKVGYKALGNDQFVWSNESSFTVGTPVQRTDVKVSAGSTANDFEMVSFVQWPINPDAELVFQDDLTGGYDTHIYRIGTYDPLKDGGSYREFGNALNIEPGRAYWIFARNGVSIKVDGVPVSLTQDIEVQLFYNAQSGDGWNMIACPNDSDYFWDTVEVVEYDASGNIVFGPVPVSHLDDPNPYIDRQLWRWADGEYFPDTELMVRYKGYWVKVLKANVFLRFTVRAQVTAEGGVIQALLKKGTRLASPASATAYTGDSPPPPIAGLTSSASITGSGDSSASGGCFIQTSSEK